GLGPIRGDGELRVTGAPAAASGVLLPPLTVTGRATLDAPTTVFLTVRVVDGTLSNGGQTLRVVVP
ncbi:MAG: hypothetical protein GWM90_20270, partial [Gemmatimonadetes bacterium]|nr:hypothetical protein [Gemmatimonadota bacterium]NIQ56799.1 hypothetical protein [Gemmatimonadota bacterium]NIU76981.1 hypothetical protein [Gammaproteobacteria bacterium]NIX46334.1 hypothetical protein [Gemmatimonadota bacterium]NIY10658.1 hypothetical protein [Gemmatimonadota bacterium]